jgi:hypothetical protein
MDHSSDAGYRAWVNDFIAQITAAGLVQTADTGQWANTGSETKPANSTVTHYVVFRFDDAMQGTAPIFIKFLFGSNSNSTNQPRIDWIVGTGSNGSGTITGTAITTQRTIMYNTTATATGTSRTCWYCHTEGAFWLAWGLSGGTTFDNGTAYANGAIIRTTDTDGDPDAIGATMWCNNARSAAYTSAFQALRFAATAAAYVAVTSTGSGTNRAAEGVPNFGESGSLVGGVAQVHPLFSYSPGVYPLFAAGLIRFTEASYSGTFTWTPLGSTSHTYLNVGTQVAHPHGNSSLTTNYGLALIWE